MSIDIIPAIMPKTFDDLHARASEVEGLVPLAQIDIMDGRFVASKSWPYALGYPERDEDFLALSRQEDGLPYWETLDYELDLMIAEPEKHLEEWLPLGASRIIIHAEAVQDWNALFALDFLNPDARRIGDDIVIALGIAFNPDTDISEYQEQIEKFDFVQCMGIAKIGYQGQPYDERVLEQINRIRSSFPNLPIAVDGGVSDKTALELVQAGATRLVAGSAIFGADDKEQAIGHLESLVSQDTLEEAEDDTPIDE
jgi:ribulose-phosphate 3-epimerase